MIISALLLGCSDPPIPRPEGVPQGAAFLRYAGNELKLDDEALGPWKDLGTEPTDRAYAPLAEALNARLTKEAGTWIALPSNASWGELRRAAHTVFEAEAGPIWIGALATDRAFGPLDNRGRAKAMLSCPEGPMPIVGVTGRLTLELQSDDTQSWIRGSMRFQPLVRLPGAEPVAADYLPETCWQPTGCAVLGAPELTRLCEAAMAAKATNESIRGAGRIEIGGQVGGQTGCLAPLYKGTKSAEAFTAAIPQSLAGLGLGGDEDVMVIADENVSLEVVFATLAGLSEAGIDNPQLGMLRMGSADGAPACNAPVTTRSQLDAAMATWFGLQLEPTP